MDAFKKILGIEPQPDYKEMITKGASIIDVRTPEEFQQGHIKGAINIPLDSLLQNTHQLNNTMPIITCCASGMRSGSATALLQSKGYQVYNGGGWRNLQSKLAA